jgi:uncharacterized membrane protein required for colicin V production
MMNDVVLSPWILDAMIGAILLACACVKGAKGLYKSLMPLAITITAAVCALLLSATLTGPVTDMVYPMVETHVISAIHLDKIPEETLEEFASYAAAPEKLVEQVTEMLPKGMLSTLSRLGVDVQEFLKENWEIAKNSETVQEYISPEQMEKLRDLGVEFKSAAGEVLDSTGAALDVEAVLFSTVFSLTRRLTSIAVHFLLWCIFCTLFLAVFTIIVNTLGLTFKLPVIGWVDKLGGAVLGVVECGVGMFILGWLLSFIGFTALHDMGEGTIIFSLFF